MLKFRKEEGLTLVELLVVIALVGVVASIALPILINSVSKAQTSADSATKLEVEKFARDWTSAGYEIDVTQGSGNKGSGAEGKLIAYEVDGPGTTVGDPATDKVAEVSLSYGKIKLADGSTPADGSDITTSNIGSGIVFTTAAG